RLRPVPLSRSRPRPAASRSRRDAGGTLLPALRPAEGRLDRTPSVDPEQVRLVFRRALEVGLDVDAVGGLGGRRLDRRLVERLAGEARLDALGAHGLGAGAGDADARLRADPLAIYGERGADADDRESGGRARE